MKSTDNQILILNEFKSMNNRQKAKLWKAALGIWKHKYYKSNNNRRRREARRRETRNNANTNRNSSSDGNNDNSQAATQNEEHEEQESQPHGFANLHNTESSQIFSAVKKKKNSGKRKGCPKMSIINKMLQLLM